jgi:hypothetical protein
MKVLLGNAGKISVKFDGCRRHVNADDLAVIDLALVN